MDVKSWLKIVEKKIIGNLHIHPQKFSLLVAKIEWNSRKKGSTAWQIKPNEFYKVCFRKWVNGTLIHLLTLSTYNFHLLHTKTPLGITTNESEKDSINFPSRSLSFSQWMRLIEWNLFSKKLLLLHVHILLNLCEVIKWKFICSLKIIRFIALLTICTNHRIPERENFAIEN